LLGICFEVETAARAGGRTGGRGKEVHEKVVVGLKFQFAVQTVAPAGLGIETDNSFRHDTIRLFRRR
jgi:hypothetical protein